MANPPSSPLLSDPSSPPALKRKRSPHELPEPIYRLEEVARNLWWSWSPEARDVFRAISLRLWRATDHNPVKMLRMVTPDRLERLAEDASFLKRYHGLLKSFGCYMAPSAAASSG